MLLFPYQQKHRGFQERMRTKTFQPLCTTAKGGYSMANENTTAVNRTFKSTLFIMLFEDKNNLLNCITL